MTWFEVGLKFGLGLLAAVALAGLVIVVVAAVCISCTEREQRRLHRAAEYEMGEVGGDGVRYCDNASCQFCVRGSCVSSIIKLVVMDDSPDEHLICETYESRWLQDD
jgi:hypothetical protein